MFEMINREPNFPPGYMVYCTRNLRMCFIPKEMGEGWRVMIIAGLWLSKTSIRNGNWDLWQTDLIVKTENQMLESLSILKSKKNGKKRRNCTILQVTETLQRNSFGKYPTKGRGDEINVSSILKLDIYTHIIISPQ